MLNPLEPIRRDMERIGRVVKGVVQPVTTVCPICGDVIEIPQYNAITRTDALIDHISSKHVGR